MRLCSALKTMVLLLASAALAATSPYAAYAAPADYKAKLDRYIQARNAFEAEAGKYWNAISEKRRIRFAKRRTGQAIDLNDYVLTQPPVYAGPPRPVDLDKDPTKPPRKPIPVVADFLKAAADHYKFVPDRAKEPDFKRAYVAAAKAAGLTRDQIVRIYAFETGGNGTYHVQSGLTHPGPKARAISTA